LQAIVTQHDRPVGLQELNAIIRSRQGEEAAKAKLAGDSAVAPPERARGDKASAAGAGASGPGGPGDSSSPGSNAAASKAATGRASTMRPSAAAADGSSGLFRTEPVVL
jgi:hypothetical protein